MDNSEKQATLGTQDTRRRQRKQNTTQKTKNRSNKFHLCCLYYWCECYSNY